MTTIERPGVDTAARAAALYRDHRTGDLSFPETAALLALGVPLDDNTVTVRVTWDTRWRDALHLDGKPIAWTAEWTTHTERPARGIHALEHGPGDDVDTFADHDSGHLDTLAQFIADLDRSPGSGFDTDAGLDIEVCGWALWAEGLLA